MQRLKNFFVIDCKKYLSTIENLYPMKKHRNLITIGLLLSGITLMYSCMSPFYKCIRGNNEVVTDSIYPNDYYTGIVHEGDMEVIITQDTINQVIIEAESNLINYIYAKVKNDYLVIKYRDNRCIRENYPVKVYVKATEINYINLTGSGNIQTDSITGNQLEIELSGSGDINSIANVDYVDAKITGSGNINLNGSCEETDFDIIGSGNINAFDLDQNKCFTRIAGSGDMRVNVSEFLDINITGSGDIYYLGNPDLSVNITGTGSVISYN
ncbi:MAG: hypothetical protein C0594_00035 [Marinilabiliales bacterium]|nr:MAG: hypothetical protein C0594_00035 [Marinilabiliales bacterium]